MRAHQAFRYFSIAWPGWRVRYPVRYPSRCEWQIVIHQVLALDFGILYQAREVDDAPMHLVRARTLNAESGVTETPKFSLVLSMLLLTEDSSGGLTCVSARWK